MDKHSSCNPQRLTGKLVGLFIFIGILFVSDILLKSGSLLLSMGRSRNCFDLLYRHATIARAIATILFVLAGRELAAQASWTTVGPAGGDARAFALLMPDGSMTPRFDSGDMLYVSPARTLEGEKIEYLERGERLQDLFGWGRFWTGYNYIVGPVEFWVCEDDAEHARARLEGLGAPAPRDPVPSDGDA